MRLYSYSGSSVFPAVLFTRVTIFTFEQASDNCVAFVVVVDEAELRSSVDSFCSSVEGDFSNASRVYSTSKRVGSDLVDYGVV